MAEAVEVEARSRQEFEAIEALLEIGEAVQADEIHLPRVLELVIDKTFALLGVDIAWMSLFSPATARLEVVGNRGASSARFDDMTVPLGRGLGGVALREGRAIVVDCWERYEADTPESVSQTLRAEGVASVMCAPMFRGATMVGALYVANRTETRFAAEHVSLLSTIATQASAAIRHAQMIGILEHRNALLEKSFSIHRELTAAGLREAGLPGIAAALARLTGLGFVLEQDLVAPYRERFGPKPSSPAPSEPITVPIVAGDADLGWIVLDVDVLAELQTIALDHGVTVIALELLKQRAARDVEWRLRGELLDEMLEVGSDCAELSERAERLGVALGVPRRIYALQTVDGVVPYGELLLLVRSRVGRRLHGMDETTLAVKRGGKVILALPEIPAELEARILNDVFAATEGKQAALCCGISEPTLDLSSALREATSCLALAEQAQARGCTVRASDLGPLRFLLGSRDLDDVQRTVDEQIGALIAHDRSSGSTLLQTLRAYLEADGHQRTVAAACFIHVSTLKYRMKKIRDLLDADIADPEVAFRLRLAFKLMDLLAAMGSGGGAGRPLP